jgi:hypothetical protein
MKQHINNVYDLPSTTHSVRYLRAVLGFPTKNTLLAAIRNGNLTTFPGLNAANAAKHFLEFVKMTKRQMTPFQQGLHSIKPKTTFSPPTTTPGIKQRDAYLRMYNATKKTMYTDQTGRFPVISQRGMGTQIHHGGRRTQQQLHRH